VSASESQLKGPVPFEPEACWNETGVQGDVSCEKLKEVIHCRHCSAYAAAGVRLLDRPLLPGYRRAWTEHFARQRSLPAPAKTSALVFRINAEWLALPAQAFQEVAEGRLVHSLPHRRQGIVLGLANIRGELVICASLGQLLGLDATPPGTERRLTYDRLLVANWIGQRFVFPADEVRGIHRFQPAELIEPPATLAKSKRSYTQGIIYWQEQPVGLLEADLLFAALNRSLT